MEEKEILKTENEKLKKINQERSDLISISVHQLRTSLSALKWILKMFQDKETGELSQKQNDLIEKAINSNDKMTELVNDLLTLNSTESISDLNNLEKIDIRELIDQVLSEFSSEAKEKNIEIIVSRENNDTPLITCDKKMIIIVLQNLIENAIKYSNENDKILITINKKNNELEVSISDNGIGIEDSEQDKIFSKFFRASNAKDKNIIGSGLGLFSTKIIIEKHKGKIWFEKNNDKGMRFIFTLPIL